MLPGLHALGEQQWLHFRTEDKLLRQKDGLKDGWKARDGEGHAIRACACRLSESGCNSQGIDLNSEWHFVYKTVNKIA